MIGYYYQNHSDLNDAARHLKDNLETGEYSIVNFKYMVIHYNETGRATENTVIEAEFIRVF
jgi:hypothetical protein